jgi:hypothetical protein
VFFLAFHTAKFSLEGFNEALSAPSRIFIPCDDSDDDELRILNRIKIIAFTCKRLFNACKILGKVVLLFCFLKLNEFMGSSSFRF